MSKTERKPADVDNHGKVTGGGGSAETLDHLVRDGQPSPSPSPSPGDRGGKEGGGGSSGGGSKSGDGPREGGKH